MAFWAYILRCSDGKFYTGHTDNLEQRIGQHQTGGYCDFTSRRRPVDCVWSEAFPSRLEALEAERIVGGWSRGKKEALIAGDWSMVSHLARPPKERVARDPFGAFRPATCTPFVSSDDEKPVPGTGFSTSLETNGSGEASRLHEGQP